VKPLVFASCAQLGVSAEDEKVLGDRNGIRHPTHCLLGDLAL